MFLQTSLPLFFMTNIKPELHFRQSFALAVVDTIIQETGFLKVDYIYIYAPDTGAFSAYLTPKGLQQARDMGERQILHNQNWRQMFDQSQAAIRTVRKLFKTKIPSLNTPEFKQFWTKLFKHTQIITEVYFYCEPPALAALEEQSNDPRIAEMLEFIGHYKLETHKTISLVEKKITQVLTLLSKGNGLDIADLLYLTSKELETILFKGVDQKIIQRARPRQSGYIYYQINNRWIVETGQNYIKWRDQLLAKPELAQVTGRTAYHVDRIVTGRAKIHLSFTDTRKLSSDAILVTGMTNPQMVPFITNIRGIITDEGGLMCHAAIISRELKIPCIVGTKEATQVFADGDLVEMDTSAGLAKKVD